MALLRSLIKCLGFRFYKHLAPNEALGKARESIRILHLFIHRQPHFKPRALAVL
jgi:hypothetical protein